MENAKIGNIIAGLRKNKVSVSESVVDGILGDVNENGSTKIPKKIKMSKERIENLLGGVVKARIGIKKSKKVDKPTKEILQDGINKAEKVLTAKKKKAKSVNEENLDPETVAELRGIEQELTDELDRALLNNEDTTEIEQGLADVREMLADVADSASKDTDRGLPAGSSSEILEGKKADKEGKTATNATDTEDYLEYNPKTKKYVLTVDGDATELTKAEIQDLFKNSGVKVDIAVFVKAQKERVDLGNVLDDADVDYKEVSEDDSQDILERKYRKLINFYKGPDGKIDFSRMKKQGDYELYLDYCSRIKNDSVLEGRTFNATSISKMKQAIKEVRKDKQQDPKKKSQHIENIKRHIKDLKRGDEMNNLKKSNGTWKIKDINSKASNIANKIKGSQKQIGDIR